MYNSTSPWQVIGGVDGYHLGTSKQGTDKRRPTRPNDYATRALGHCQAPTSLLDIIHFPFKRACFHLSPSHALSIHYVRPSAVPHTHILIPVKLNLCYTPVIFVTLFTSCLLPNKIYDHILYVEYNIFSSHNFCNSLLWPRLRVQFILVPSSPPTLRPTRNWKIRQFSAADVSQKPRSQLPTKSDK